MENGEVTALLDITKCLYDAIVRLEKVAEKGDAIAAAVQGVEVQYGNVISGIKYLFHFQGVIINVYIGGVFFPSNFDLFFLAPFSTIDYCGCAS